MLSIVYFSVGDREKHARSPRLSAVEDCTRRAAEWAGGYCDSVLFELQPGGHFDRPEERLQKAIRFLISE